MPHVNHLTVPAPDPEATARFYVDWFGAEPIPSPSFPVPVAWLLLGGVQLHLVARGTPSDPYHFGIEVAGRERFESLCRRAERDGVADRTTFAHHLYRTASGTVQLYLTDPAGNLVECDYPRADDLDPEISAQLRVWTGTQTPPDADERIALAHGPSGADS